MKKPYILTAHNKLEELIRLEAEALINNPLRFLDDNNSEISNNKTFFELSVESLFIIIDESMIDVIKETLIDFGYNLTVEDATEKLLFDQINFKNITDDVKEEINKYYIKTYDFNDVLDKINTVGIEKLNELDKSILNKKTLSY
jgi:hypothetical protein